MDEIRIDGTSEPSFVHSYRSMIATMDIEAKKNFLSAMSATKGFKLDETGSEDEARHFLHGLTAAEVMEQFHNIYGDPEVTGGADGASYVLYSPARPGDVTGRSPLNDEGSP